MNKKVLSVVLAWILIVSVVPPGILATHEPGKPHTDGTITVVEPVVKKEDPLQQFKDGALSIDDLVRDHLELLRKDKDLLNENFNKINPNLYEKLNTDELQRNIDKVDDLSDIPADKGVDYTKVKEPEKLGKLSKEQLNFAKSGEESALQKIGKDPNLFKNLLGSDELSKALQEDSGFEGKPLELGELQPGATYVGGVLSNTKGSVNLKELTTKEDVIKVVANKDGSIDVHAKPGESGVPDPGAPTSETGEVLIKVEAGTLTKDTAGGYNLETPEGSLHLDLSKVTGGTEVVVSETLIDRKNAEGQFLNINGKVVKTKEEAAKFVTQNIKLPPGAKLTQANHVVVVRDVEPDEEKIPTTVSISGKIFGVQGRATINGPVGRVELVKSNSVYSQHGKTVSATGANAWLTERYVDETGKEFSRVTDYIEGDFIKREVTVNGESKVTVSLGKIDSKTGNLVKSGGLKSEGSFHLDVTTGVGSKGQNVLIHKDAYTNRKSLYATNPNPPTPEEIKKIVEAAKKSVQSTTDGEVWIKREQDTGAVKVYARGVVDVGFYEVNVKKPLTLLEVDLPVVKTPDDLIDPDPTSPKGFSYTVNKPKGETAKDKNAFLDLVKTPDGKFNFYASGVVNIKQTEEVEVGGEHIEFTSLNYEGKHAGAFINHQWTEDGVELAEVNCRNCQEGDDFATLSRELVQYSYGNFFKTDIPMNFKWENNKAVVQRDDKAIQRLTKYNIGDSFVVVKNDLWVTSGKEKVEVTDEEGNKKTITRPRTVGQIRYDDKTGSGIIQIGDIPILLKAKSEIGNVKGMYISVDDAESNVILQNQLKAQKTFDKFKKQMHEQGKKQVQIDRELDFVNKALARERKRLKEIGSESTWTESVAFWSKSYTRSERETLKDTISNLEDMKSSLLGQQFKLDAESKKAQDEIKLRYDDLIESFREKGQTEQADRLEAERRMKQLQLAYESGDSRVVHKLAVELRDNHPHLKNNAQFFRAMTYLKDGKYNDNDMKAAFFTFQKVASCEDCKFKGQAQQKLLMLENLYLDRTKAGLGAAGSLIYQSLQDKFKKTDDGLLLPKSINWNIVRELYAAGAESNIRDIAAQHNIELKDKETGVVLIKALRGAGLSWSQIEHVKEYGFRSLYKTDSDVRSNLDKIYKESDGTGSIEDWTSSRDHRIQRILGETMREQDVDRIKGFVEGTLVKQGDPGYVRAQRIFGEFDHENPWNYIPERQGELIRQTYIAPDWLKDEGLRSAYETVGEMGIHMTNVEGIALILVPGGAAKLLGQAKWAPGVAAWAAKAAPTFYKLGGYGLRGASYLVDGPSQLAGVAGTKLGFGIAGRTALGTAAMGTEFYLDYQAGEYLYKVTGNEAFSNLALLVPVAALGVRTGRAQVVNKATQALNNVDINWRQQASGFGADLDGVTFDPPSRAVDVEPNLNQLRDDLTGRRPDGVDEGVWASKVDDVIDQAKRDLADTTGFVSPTRADVDAADNANAMDAANDLQQELGGADPGQSPVPNADTLPDTSTQPSDAGTADAGAPDTSSPDSGQQAPGSDSGQAAQPDSTPLDVDAPDGSVSQPEAAGAPGDTLPPPVEPPLDPDVVSQGLRGEEIRRAARDQEISRPLDADPNDVIDKSAIDAAKNEEVIRRQTEQQDLPVNEQQPPTQIEADVDANPPPDLLDRADEIKTEAQSKGDPQQFLDAKTGRQDLVKTEMDKPRQRKQARQDLPELETMKTELDDDITRMNEDRAREIDSVDRQQRTEYLTEPEGAILNKERQQIHDSPDPVGEVGEIAASRAKKSSEYRDYIKTRYRESPDLIDALTDSSHPNHQKAKRQVGKDLWEQAGDVLAPHEPVNPRIRELDDGISQAHANRNEVQSQITDARRTLGDEPSLRGEAAEPVFSGPESGDLTPVERYHQAQAEMDTFGAEYNRLNRESSSDPGIKSQRDEALKNYQEAARRQRQASSLIGCAVGIDCQTGNRPTRARDPIIPEGDIGPVPDDRGPISFPQSEPLTPTQIGSELGLSVSTTKQGIPAIKKPKIKEVVVTETGAAFTVSSGGFRGKKQSFTIQPDGTLNGPSGRLSPEASNILMTDPKVRDPLKLEVQRQIGDLQTRKADFQNELSNQPSNPHQQRLDRNIDSGADMRGGFDELLWTHNTDINGLEGILGSRQIMGDINNRGTNFRYGLDSQYGEVKIVMEPGFETRYKGVDKGQTLNDPVVDLFGKGSKYPETPSNSESLKKKVAADSTFRQHQGPGLDSSAYNPQLNLYGSVSTNNIKRILVPEHLYDQVFQAASRSGFDVSKIIKVEGTGVANSYYSYSQKHGIGSRRQAIDEGMIPDIFSRDGKLRQRGSSTSMATSPSSFHLEEQAYFKLLAEHQTTTGRTPLRDLSDATNIHPSFEAVLGSLEGDVMSLTTSRFGRTYSTGSSVSRTYVPNSNGMPADLDLVVQGRIGNTPTQFTNNIQHLNDVADGIIHSDAFQHTYGTNVDYYIRKVSRDVYGTNFDTAFLVFCRGRCPDSFSNRRVSNPLLEIDISFKPDPTPSLYRPHFDQQMRTTTSNLNPGETQILQDHITHQIRMLKKLSIDSGVYKNPQGGLLGVGSEQLILGLNGGRPVASLDEGMRAFTLSKALEKVDNSLKGQGPPLEVRHPVTGENLADNLHKTQKDGSTGAEKMRTLARRHPDFDMTPELNRQRIEGEIRNLDNGINRLGDLDRRIDGLSGDALSPGARVNAQAAADAADSALDRFRRTDFYRRMRNRAMAGAVAAVAGVTVGTWFIWPRDGEPPPSILSPVGAAPVGDEEVDSSVNAVENALPQGALTNQEQGNALSNIQRVLIQNEEHPPIIIEYEIKPERRLIPGITKEPLLPSAPSKREILPPDKIPEHPVKVYRAWDSSTGRQIAINGNLDNTFLSDKEFRDHLLRVYDYNLRSSFSVDPPGPPTRSSGWDDDGPGTIELSQINVDVNYVLEDGATNAVTDTMQNNAIAYFDTLVAGQVVIKQDLENSVCNVDGVQECSINQPTGDIAISNYQKAILGTFT